jgi:methyltransferase, FkbM family
MASWTLEFTHKYWPYMSVPSLLRLRGALLAERRGRINFQSLCDLALVKPFRANVAIRPASNDIYTLQEVVIEEIYGGVLEACPRPQTIVDLGANIGLATLFFAARYPQAHLLAVEPYPPNVELLRRNLSALCAAGRCTIVDRAIWSSNEKLGVADLASAGHVNQVKLTADRRPCATTVRGITIAELIRAHHLETIDLLKVDIEGGETELLRGELSWLSRVGCIAIEFHDDSRAATGFDAIMSRYGFRIVSDGAHTVIASRDEVPCVY